MNVDMGNERGVSEVSKGLTSGCIFLSKTVKATAGEVELNLRTVLLYPDATGG